MSAICKFEKHSWKTLRSTIVDVAQPLSKIIDELSPDDNYSLYYARYDYGDLILDKGIFHIPAHDSRGVLSLYHASVPNKLRDDLDYNHTIPVGLVIKNTFESFMVVGQRVVPATLFKPGDLLALWRVFDEKKSFQDGSFWTISSGARTICMLPKITDKNGYRLLKAKHNLHTHMPKA